MGAIRIDDVLVPSRVLLDTSVLVMALGGHQSDARAPTCVALWETLIKFRRNVLIAAPTVAELMRSDKKTSLPRTPVVQTVAFDTVAAEELASKFPQRILVVEQQASALPMNYIKYDALIVACALRHKADELVTYDVQMSKMAESAGLKARRPEAYLAKQTELELTPP